MKVHTLHFDETFYRFINEQAGRNEPIPLKKSVGPSYTHIDSWKRHFCTLLRKICAQKTLQEVWISISDAYFSVFGDPAGMEDPAGEAEHSERAEIRS